MQTHDLIQSSQAWHEFRRPPRRNASDTPKVTGHHPTVSRTEFMGEWVHGIKKEFSGYVQDKILDVGHRDEARARPLMAEIVGESLSPIVGGDGCWSASFDGVNFDESICAEHKSLNNLLRSCKTAADLPIYHREQMEHQLMVSGAAKCLFLATKWNDDDTLAEEVHFWYEPDLALRAQIIAAWDQFLKDAETYTPPEVIPQVVAAPIKDLPAITYKMDGMHLSTNLRNDVKPAILALVEQSKRKLETDQDFADLDALCKKFKQAEEQCALVQSQAVGEIKDVDAFCRDLKELSEIMRQARIAGEKAVTSEKDARKLAILTKAKADYAAHISALEAETKPITLQIPQLDLASAMKGLKKLSAMQEAVDNALRDGKMLADSAAKDVRAKLIWCKEHAANNEMLFADMQQIITKPMDDFCLVVKFRIDKHNADEAARIERIRAEEQVKAEKVATEKMFAEVAKAEAAAAEVFEAARVKAEQEAKAKAEADGIAAEVTRLSNERIAETTKETLAAAEHEAAAIEARRKQAQIAEQSKPFNGVPAKPVRPGAAEIIGVIMNAYSVDYNIACDWIIDVAENLRVAA